MANYKALLIVPLVLIIFSTVFLVYNYNNTGEWLLRSVELKGGTLITLNDVEVPDVEILEKALSEIFGNAIVKESRGFTGNSVSIELDNNIDSSKVLQELESMELDTTHSSIGSIGPALGETFYAQALTAIVMAFMLMGIIVFVLFRRLIPSFAVMMAAISDIVITLAFMQILSIELSLAGMAAILMLIGYSVDTDILLTTRLLKGEGPLNKRVRNALKTGLTLSITSIGALVALYLSSASPVLSQIALVLLIGLTIDIINTWLQNSVLLRWHLERKGVE